MSLALTKTASRAPSRRGGGRGRLWACLGLFLLAAACLGHPAPARAELALELVETYSGKVALRVPIQAGEPFTLWFLHSYDRAFFAEHYRALGPGRIMLTHMTFKSNLNGEGFEYHDFRLRKDGVGELRNINKIIKRVNFMQGSPDMANHTLILRGKRIRLVKYVAPRTLVDLVVVEVKPRPALNPKP